MRQISAGIRWREIDLSHYAPALSSTIVGLVGTASKGPLNERRYIGSVEQLVQVYGYPDEDYPALYAALQYLREGNQLWFIRVESAANPATRAEVSVNGIDSVAQLWKARDFGTFYNGAILKVTHAAPMNTTDSAEADGTEDTFAYTLTAPVVPGTVTLKAGATLLASDNGEGAITGTGITGTVNYLTGAVAITFTAAPAAATHTLAGQHYSTFNVEVFKVIENKSFAIETFRNLGLNNLQENYYATVLASSVVVEAPADLEVFPQVGSYVLAGGDDGLAGLNDADYIGMNLGTVSTGLQAFADPEAVDVNVVAVPGISSGAVVQALVALAESRQDCMVLPDPPRNLSVESVVDWINGSGAYASQNAINSSYAAVYYPWVKIPDSYNRKEVWAAPSGFALAAFARSELHYAPAGGARGKVLGSTGVERILNEGQRVLLYNNRVNPISDFVASGILIWGQKTTQVESSDLDRVVARRVLLAVEKVVVTGLRPLVFEPNNRYTWNRARSIVQPFLDGMVAKGALIYGKVVCDENTNTPEVVARNEMVVNVFLKLPKTAEIITVNFVLLATAANVEEYLGRQF